MAEPLTQENLDTVKSLVAQREALEWFDPRAREIDTALAGVAGDLVAEVERLQKTLRAIVGTCYGAPTSVWDVCLASLAVERTALK